MRKIIALAAVLLGASAALAELDLSTVEARIIAKAGTTTGKKRAAYTRLQRLVARADRTGLADDFVKLREVGRASRRGLSDDAELATGVDEALIEGLNAIFSKSTELVELTLQLTFPRDRAKCSAYGVKGNRLSDASSLARLQGHPARSGELARRAAVAYETGIALAHKLLDRQNGGELKWSVPVHDLGGAMLSVVTTPETAEFPASVYACGADDGSGPIFLRKAAEGWIRVPMGAAGNLWWVSHIENEIWTSGTLARVARYDPATGGVTQIPVPMNEGESTTLYGVWGVAANDVWTVGGNVDGSLPRQSFFHWDGTQWTNVSPTLPPEVNDRTLFKVWGTAANDVWVCGQAGLILHYDGSEWTTEPSSTFESLFTVHGNSPTIVVGGSVQPTIVENGIGGFSSVLVPPGSETMRGIFVPQQGDAWSCGLNATVLRRTAGHWVKQANLPAASGRDFHALTLDAAGGVWLAGGDLLKLEKGSLFYFGAATQPTGIYQQAKLRAQVAPLLYNRCAITACHIGPFISENLDLSTPEVVLAQQVNIIANQLPSMMRVLPGRPQASYTWHKIVGSHASVHGSGDRMPQGGPYLQLGEADLVRAWILEGAQDN